MTEGQLLRSGLIKMRLEIRLYNEHIEAMETKVLHSLVRDYHVFYSKKEAHVKDCKLFEFYCYPQYEVSVAYQLGCLSQAALVFFDDEYFARQIHRVPDGFPGCIQVENE